MAPPSLFEDKEYTARREEKQALMYTNGWGDPGKKKKRRGETVHSVEEGVNPMKLNAGLRKLFNTTGVGNGKVRMAKRGRTRRPPTREEYGMADRFIGTMVGLLPGDPDGEII